MPRGRGFGRGRGRGRGQRRDVRRPYGLRNRAVQNNQVVPGPAQAVEQQQAVHEPAQNQMEIPNNPVVPPAVMNPVPVVEPVQRQGNNVALPLSNYIETVQAINSNEPLLVPGFSNETDIFVPQNVKEKVWNFEFVDLAQFLRQNFESNMDNRPSNIEVMNGKLVLQQREKKIKSIDNLSTWTNAFLNYMSVLIENHPNKAGELIRYMTIIRNVADEIPSSRWIMYDQQFRLRVSRNPSRVWSSIDGELWLRFISTPVARINQTPRANIPEACCYDFNYKGFCRRKNCIFRHSCLKCRMQHPSKNCTSNMGSYKSPHSTGLNIPQKSNQLFKTNSK